MKALQPLYNHKDVVVSEDDVKRYTDSAQHRAEFENSLPFVSASSLQPFDNSRCASKLVRSMEYRFLGGSGLRVPVLTFGTGTFGGKGKLFSAWGDVGVAEAKRLVSICLDAGVTMFDSADGYSDGMAEEILGKAIAGRRDRVLISTKATFRVGEGPNEVGSSRFHLVRAIEKALKRLRTDYIDLFQLHAFDAQTPVEETLSTLDTLVRAGKIRYAGCSNFSGWHLMKSLAAADRYGYPRYVAHQAYYSLIGRDYEWELMPLGWKAINVDSEQTVGADHSAARAIDGDSSTIWHTRWNAGQKQPHAITVDMGTTHRVGGFTYPRASAPFPIPLAG